MVRTQTSTGDAAGGAFIDRYLGFASALRRAGIPVDIDRMTVGLRALEWVGVGNRGDIRDALEAVLVSREADRDLYRDAFELWFSPDGLGGMADFVKPSDERHQATPSVSRRLSRAAPPWALKSMSYTIPPDVQLDGNILPSARERLRFADFSGLSDAEFEEVLRFAQTIPLALPRYHNRRLRKRKQLSDKNPVDWCTSVSEACRTCGEFVNLYHLSRRSNPVPILALVDVSGSMKRYARIALAFLHSALRPPVCCDVFAFGTRLSDVRKCFKTPDTEKMLARANDVISDYAGGTRIGPSLKELRRNFSHCISRGRTVAVLITDGLETGDISVLRAELEWMQRNVRAIIWLNPMLRYDGYTNATKGAKVFSEFADVSLAVHNLDSLQGLSSGLAAALQALD